jgi:AGZA family xanthine/uracil permease-like MFS transporter
MFVGIEIVSQAFMETPRRHAPAVAFATIPVVAYLVLINMDGLVGKLGPAVKLSETLLAEQTILRTTANGFILTAMLWGGLLAELLEGRLKRASIHAFICAFFTLFGIIHSVSPGGDVYLPWNAGNDLAWQVALGYGFMAAFFWVASRAGGSR